MPATVPCIRVIELLTTACTEKEREKCVVDRQGSDEMPPTLTTGPISEGGQQGGTFVGAVLAVNQPYQGSEKNN